MQALLSRITIAAAAAMLSSAVPIHQAATPTQTGRTPQFENDDVKVWRSLIQPGTPLPLHRHDHPRVIVALRGGTMNIIDADGTKEVHPWETNHAYWLPAMPPGHTHQDANAGTEPIEVMVIELEHEH